MISASFARVSMLAALTWAGAGASLHACPICFQFDDRSASAGVTAAVLVLGGVTVAVLVPCAAFALRLARRDRSPHPPAPDHLEP